MLLNCSRHPSTQWPRAQRDTAETMYGSIQDIAYPSIDPLHTSAQIAELAQAYAHQIIAQRPSGVHIMGEPTFVYATVRLLQAQGITCLASATKRGNGRGLYEFVQFRPYPVMGGSI